MLLPLHPALNTATVDVHADMSVIAVVKAAVGTCCCDCYDVLL